MTWNKESITRTIKEYLIKAELPYEDEDIDSKIACAERQGKLFDVNKKTISFSLPLINHPKMPENVINAVFAFAALIIHAYTNKITYNGWNAVTDAVKTICEKNDIVFISDTEIEAVVRPLRRELYPDPNDEGCYFRKGDLLHCRMPGRSRFSYLITDIQEDPATGIIIIIFRQWNALYPKIDAMSEESVYEEFGIIENSSSEPIWRC